MSGSAENLSDSKCHLISGMKYIYNCPFYWGKMDLFEAKQILTVGPWADVKNDFTWKIIIVLKVRDGHGE